jgi:outer membrane protein assembly factor BamB
MKLKRTTAVAIVLALGIFNRLGADWPEAAGPNHNYIVRGTASTAFSVSLNKAVLWRTPLPNTGESTPVISGNRVFLTCHTPISGDGQLGSTIFGLCFDATSGRELWRREIPATRQIDMASGFSDNTAASPVTDGTRVCFINVGGAIRTFDFDGNLVWKYDWVPFGRHHSRQQEPIFHDGKVILLRVVAGNLPLQATTKPGAAALGPDRQYWTRLQAFDLADGKQQWTAECGTSVHSASMLGKAGGHAVILTGRGGGHQPLERPYGLSLLDAASGKERWNLPIDGYAAHQNAVFNDDVAAYFVGKTHHTLDLATGQVTGSVSIEQDVKVRRHTPGGYQSVVESRLQLGKKGITYHTNCLVGDYHYFRAHGQYLIGRVSVKTHQVEYLQVPVQVVRSSQEPEQLLWEKALPNDAKNNDGFVVCQDKRAMKDGWGHVSAASPLVVGDYLYMPTMIGVVYVLKWNAATLDENALVSISDLGPAQQTWSLSSLSASEGRIYARTMKELICLQAPAAKSPATERGKRGKSR